MASIWKAARINLHQLNPAFGGFVITVNQIGAHILLVDDCFNGEAIVNVVFGYTGFLYAVDAIGQPGCFGNTIAVRGDGRHNFAVAAAIV